MIKVRDKVQFKDGEHVRYGTVLTVPGTYSIDGHVMRIVRYVVSVYGFSGGWQVDPEDIIKSEQSKL